MGTLADFRQGRDSRAVPLAAAGECLLVTGVAWVAWQVIEGDASTLRDSQFPTWLTVVAVGAAVSTVLNAVFWRAFKVRVALAGGFVLSVVLVLLGLLNDILSSAS